jgi:hypothetical protein
MVRITLRSKTLNAHPRGGALEAQGNGWKGDWKRGDTVNDDRNYEAEFRNID